MFAVNWALQAALAEQRVADLVAAAERDRQVRQALGSRPERRRWFLARPAVTGIRSRAWWRGKPAAAPAGGEFDGSAPDRA